MKAARTQALGVAGEVVSTHGRHFAVQVEDGSVLQCYPRGKKGSIACGDRVSIQVTGPGQGVIETVDPRSTLLYRADTFKQKLIAANVTQAAIVVASSPSYYDELVTRCLIACSVQDIRAFIVLNKCDLIEESRAALRRLQVYDNLGYRVLALSALGDVSPLRECLSGERTVLVGQSGMGKSTLVNALIPQAEATVGEISLALDSGRHTTTSTRMYRLDAHSSLIDSPGMQEFGIAHLTPSQLMHAFPEFSALLGHCRFADCLHVNEPGCAISAAAATLPAERLRFYRKLVVSLRDARKLY